MAEKAKAKVPLTRLLEAERQRGAPLTKDERDDAIADLMDCRALLYGMPHLGGRIHEGQNVSFHLRILIEALKESGEQHDRDREELRELRDQRAAVRRFLGLPEG